MCKKIVPFRKKDKDSKGDKKMEAVLNRGCLNTPIRKSTGTAINVHNAQCEMRVLMNFNSRVLRKNGFSDDDVARIIEEERAKNAKSRSRY